MVVSAQRCSSNPPAETAPEPCHALALIAGGSAAAVSGLFHFGWALSGHVSALTACLVTAVIVAGAVHLGGRLRGVALAIHTASFALAGVAAGQLLIADFAGVTGQGPLRLAAEGTAHAWINQAAYLATPVLAAALVPLAARLDHFAQAFTLKRLPLPRPLAASTRQRRLRRRAVPPSAASAEAPEARASDRVTASGPRPGRWRAVLILLAALWLGLMVVLQSIAAGGQRHGFLLISFPCEPVHADNTLLGFASLQGGRPVMSETVPAMEQVTWFSGAVRSDNNFRFGRAGYSFLAVQLAPLLGIRGALLAVNWISWGLCLALLWRAAMRLFDDPPAAAIAVLLAAAAIGFAVHLPATAPHLLAFALYYAGVLLVLELGMADAPRPWRVHCVQGLAIGMIGLVYNVHVMVLFVYLVTSIGRQRLLYLCGASLIAFAIPQVWRGVLPALGINIAEVQSDYLLNALAAWGEALQSGPGAFSLMLLRVAAEAVTACVSPWIAVTGGLGLMLTMPRARYRWWALVTLAAPVLACVLFAPAATARGYITFGATVVLFAAAGKLFSEGLSRGRLWRNITLVALGTLLAGQAIWSTTHFRGPLGPIKAYFLGWDDGSAVLRNEPTEVHSLTGAEPVPAVFGGTAPLAEAGAVWTPPTEPIARRSRPLALLARLPFVVALALFLCTVYPRRTARRTVVGLLAVMLIGGAELSYRTLQAQPATGNIDRAVRLEPGHAVTYRVAVAAETLNAIGPQLRSATNEAGLHVRTSGTIDVDWRINGRPVPLQPIGNHLHRLPPDAARELGAAAAGRSSHWTLVLTNRGNSDAWITGWQDPRQPRRTLTGDAEAWALPAVELRVWGRDDGFLKAAAF